MMGTMLGKKAGIEGACALLYEDWGVRIVDAPIRDIRPCMLKYGRITPQRPGYASIERRTRM
jgi:hypothetical protein